MIMNKKSIFVLLAMLFTVMGMTACSDETVIGDSRQMSNEFKVSVNSLTFSKTGGETYVYVQAPSEPAISTDASWCTLTKVASESSAVFKYLVSVPANTDMADRSGNISVNGTNIPLLQKAAEGLVVTSSKTISMPAAGGSFDVSLKANAAYTVSIDNAWIVEAGSTGSAQDFSHSFQVLGNTQNQARTGAVSFTMTYDDDQSIVEKVTVSQEASTAGEGMRNAKTIAALMYPGWNLGNTLEGGSNSDLYKNVGIGTETAWQGTKTTQTVIDMIRDNGFRAVRVPASWVMGHITNADELTIDEAWMNRVKEVVDYCINDGLYVVLNDHWDGGWLENSFGDTSDATVTANSEKLRKVWTQIANAFKGYDDHLLFAGLNEPGMGGSGFNATTVKALYKYEQAFIDAVRATGGNNATRVLIVQGPETDISQTNKYYDAAQITDPAGEGHLMVEVHYYTPWTFCGLEADADWGKICYYWGNGNKPADGERYYANGESELKSSFKTMYDKFVSKGYPVIVGECGANYRFSGDALHDASIKAWYKNVAEQSVSYGCIPFYWDTNYTGYPNMTVFNRNTLQVNNSLMLDGIKEGIAAAAYPAQ